VPSPQCHQLIVDRCLSLEAFGRIDEKRRGILGDRVRDCQIFCV